MNRPDRLTKEELIQMNDYVLGANKNKTITEGKIKEPLSETKVKENPFRLPRIGNYNRKDEKEQLSLENSLKFSKTIAQPMATLLLIRESKDMSD